MADGMTKIEQFKKVLRTAESIERSINLCLARAKGGGQIDKNALQFVVARCDKSDRHLILDARYGHYGCSSCYDQNSLEMTEYLARAANEFMEAIADRAIALAKLDVAKTRSEAVEEANLVLAGVQEAEKALQG